MRKLIDMEAAIGIVRHECGKWTGLAKEIVKQFNGLPPVDAVLVVRCGDCKFYDLEIGDDEYALGWCPFIKSHLVLSKGFCFWGKRKEDGHE